MLLDHLNRKLQAIAAQDLTRVLRVAQSATAPVQTVRGADGNTRAMLMFCSNDYLGLAAHPALAEAFVDGVRRYGAGSGASHLISGHGLAHEQLEQALAAWMAPQIPNAQALFFCTGYMANLAVLSALGDADAEIFSDELNHASIIDGARLAKAPVQRYAHCDVRALQTLLAASAAKVKLIVTDAVFSMDGDMAPLDQLLALAEAHDAWLIVDDAHGFGVLGPQGRGTPAHFGLCSERLIVMGTLGKAAGVSGAFVAAHPTVTQYLLQAARTYIFTTAAPPAVAHALLTSLQLMAGDEGEQRRAQLRQLQAQLRDGVAHLLSDYPRLGWRLLPSQTPVQALIIGENAATMRLAARLDAAGLRVPGIRPPTVPKGTARLRITLCASHTPADIQRLLQALQDALAERPGAAGLPHGEPAAPAGQPSTQSIPRGGAGLAGFFVTGTDTGIGKTCVSAGLTHLLGQAGYRAVAIKSVASGQDLQDGRWVNEDVQRLRQASNMDVTDAEVGPLQMRSACAPHIAAQIEGVCIARDPLVAAIRSVAARADVCVIEGVGGFRVPLTTGWDTADLAVDLQLPVVLVVGMRLGCINHALLSAEAVRARGLRLVGWVANTVDADMAYRAENLAALEEALQAPCWGRVPRLADSSHSAVAAHLDRAGVLAAVQANRTLIRPA